jgi:ADP-ribose pyrophosphatase YjhB (NUDIX family)
VRRVHLAHGIVERDRRILLVASKYPNQPESLWNLPGGRQRQGELLDETVRREFAEEVGLVAEVHRLRYVAESYDASTDTQFTSFVFGVAAAGTARANPSDAHVVDCAWVPLDELSARLTVRVVRTPLLEHLADGAAQYFGYAEAGITIEFRDEP